MILFKNCRLIPELTEGYEGTIADVLVSDDHLIAEIGAPGKIQAPEVVIDVEGNTLLPGFFDLHAHLCLADLDFKELRNRSCVDSCFEMYDYAREYLKQGYTTVRDAGGPFNVTVGLKKAARNGVINIPDIISSGQIITPTEIGNETFESLYYPADSPYEVRKACRRQFELGNDVIKYMVTGAYLNEAGNPGDSIATEDELKEAVEIAAMKNSYVMGHAHGAEGIKLAIRCGIRTIEHGSFIDAEAVEMLKNTDKTYLVPTAAIGLACLDDDGSALSDDAVEKSKKYEMAEKQAINNAYQAGLKMGFGSDIDRKNFCAHPGMEFYARTDWFDFDYTDILLQATKYSAEIAGMADRKGTIKVGKNAELVVIKGKPDEDIYVMKEMPLYVYYKGELIENK
ncbi:MAG: amidohydrolase family protein [Firmicutes bacterium]|nr:amidohydrolase family protein [Bacillota bacterium]